MRMSGSDSVFLSPKPRNLTRIKRFKQKDAFTRFYIAIMDTSLRRWTLFKRNFTLRRSWVLNAVKIAFSFSSAYSMLLWITVGLQVYSCGKTLPSKLPFCPYEAVYGGIPDKLSASLNQIFSFSVSNDILAWTFYIWYMYLVVLLITWCLSTVRAWENIQFSGRNIYSDLVFFEKNDNEVFQLAAYNPHPAAVKTQLALRKPGMLSLICLGSYYYLRKRYNPVLSLLPYLHTPLPHAPTMLPTDPSCNPPFAPRGALR